MKKIALKNAARGTAFDYAGQSWILLENDDGRALRGRDRAGARPVQM